MICVGTVKIITGIQTVLHMYVCVCKHNTWQQASVHVAPLNTLPFYVDRYHDMCLPSSATVHCAMRRVLLLMVPVCGLSVMHKHEHAHVIIVRYNDASIDS